MLFLQPLPYRIRPALVSMHLYNAVRTLREIQHHALLYTGLSGIIPQAFIERWTSIYDWLEIWMNDMLRSDLGCTECVEPQRKSSVMGSFQAIAATLTASSRGLISFLHLSQVILYTHSKGELGICQEKTRAYQENLDFTTGFLPCL